MKFDMLFSRWFWYVKPCLLNFFKEFLFQNSLIFVFLDVISHNKDDFLGLLWSKKFQIKFKDDFKNGQLRTFIEPYLLDPQINEQSMRYSQRKKRVSSLHFLNDKKIVYCSLLSLIRITALNIQYHHFGGYVNTVPDPLGGLTDSFFPIECIEFCIEERIEECAFTRWLRTNDGYDLIFFTEWADFGIGQALEFF